jgi:hypothetical protein
MTEDRRRSKGRSPSYPGIALGEAIQKAAILYEKEGRHAADSDTITGHWGYKPKTGPGLVAIAALKRFGLLEDEGGNGARRARLTQLALSIVLHEEGSPERQQWVREAALMPAIHAELWKQFDGRLPSDQNLRRVLVMDRAFTDSGAQQFIRQFKNTIAYAKLTESGKMPESQLPQHRPAGEPMVAQTIGPAGIPSEEAFGTPRVSAEAGSHPQVRTLPIPVDSDPSVWPVLQVPIPMTEELWEQMLAALAVFKRGVVRKAADADDRPSAGPSAESPPSVSE